MLKAPSKMVRFNYGPEGPEKGRQWWKVSCDCLAIYTLEEFTKQTIDEFFDVRGAYEEDATRTAGQLLGLVLASHEGHKVQEASRTPESPPVPPVDAALNALLTHSADLLQKLVVATKPRPKSDWYKLLWAMTAGWREDANIPLDFRGFLRVIPVGAEFNDIMRTMSDLYNQHLTGVDKAAELGNASAPGQPPTGPASPNETTGPGAGKSIAVWVDDPSESSGAEASPVTTP